MLFAIIIVALFVLMISSLVYDHKHFNHLIDVAPDAILFKVVRFCKWHA